MSYIQESILKYLRNTTKEIGNISRRNRKCKMDGTLEKRRRSLNFHAQEIDILLALINLDKTTIGKY
ncbi:hypothetical protein HHI36_020643 [Cryptolaemus montrouzieri]|uniref:Transposase n=1 Tax=Cryptolaemus montrouzieri TaxID=559131 RepID=A0ABD2NAX3_9CUCU